MDPELKRAAAALEEDSAATVEDETADVADEGEAADVKGEGDTAVEVEDEPPGAAGVEDEGLPADPRIEDGGP